MTEEERVPPEPASSSGVQRPVVFEDERMRVYDPQYCFSDVCGAESPVNLAKNKDLISAAWALTMDLLKREG